MLVTLDRNSDRLGSILFPRFSVNIYTLVAIGGDSQSSWRGDLPKVQQRRINEEFLGTGRGTAVASQYYSEREEFLCPLVFSET